MANVLALDIGGSAIKYGLFSEDAKLISRDKLDIVRTNLAGLLDDIESIGMEFQGRFDGVAVSMPGSIDSISGIAKTGGVFDFIKDTPFAKLVSETLADFSANPSEPLKVVIANDANCAVLAELKSGALKGVLGGAVLVLGSSIGGGIIINGKIWEGAHMSAGEPAYMPVSICDLANAETSGSDYDKLFNNDIFCGNHCSATGLIDDYKKVCGLEADHSAKGGRELFEKLAEEDEKAKEALDIFSKKMASQIYSIQAILDLETYAIGGGITGNDFLVSAISFELDKLFEKYHASPVVKPEIKKCKYGPEANLYGAFYAYLDRQ